MQNSTKQLQANTLAYQTQLKNYDISIQNAEKNKETAIEQANVTADNTITEAQKGTEQVQKDFTNGTNISPKITEPVKIVPAKTTPVKIVPATTTSAKKLLVQSGFEPKHLKIQFPEQPTSSTPASVNSIFSNSGFLDKEPQTPVTSSTSTKLLPMLNNVERSPKRILLARSEKNTEF